LRNLFGLLKLLFMGVLLREQSLFSSNPLSFLSFYSVRFCLLLLLGHGLGFNLSFDVQLLPQKLVSTALLFESFWVLARASHAQHTLLVDLRGRRYRVERWNHRLERLSGVGNW
jgi:hypothetical protein